MATTAGRQTTRPSSAVIDALAEVTDTDPLSMDPLYNVVDPEALDALFKNDVDGQIRFEYHDHVVTVRSDGTVTVDGTSFEPGFADR